MEHLVDRPTGTVIDTIDNLAQQLAEQIAVLPVSARVDALNRARRALHAISPFAQEPVDFVEWVESGTVEANDYNPNCVAPPEKKLLALSIRADGYTQPIVTWVEENCREVVDGFHRTQVGKEDAEVRKRVLGYLPTVAINSGRSERPDRIAATIRHNKARGKHLVQLMSEIVRDLARRNWSSEKIARELGMDADEVLRLKQISGLAELFADRNFNAAWEPND